MCRNVRYAGDISGCILPCIPSSTSSSPSPLESCCRVVSVLASLGDWALPLGVKPPPFGVSPPACNRLALPKDVSLVERRRGNGNSMSALGDGKKYDSFAELCRISPWPIVAPNGGCADPKPERPPSWGW